MCLGSELTRQPVAPAAPNKGYRRSGHTVSRPYDSNVDSSIQNRSDPRDATCKLGDEEIRQGAPALSCRSRAPSKQLSREKIAICQAALVLARHVSIFGVGEGEKAHGFTIVVGESDQLLARDADGDGIIGESNMADSHAFSSVGFKEVVTNPDCKLNRSVIAAFKEDGAVIIDSMTGEFVSMNYFVSNIAKGDKTGGARHKSASALAQAAGGCYVIKASEEVTKSGQGFLDVFDNEKKSRKVSVMEKKDHSSMKHHIGRLLIDIGEYDLAITLLEKMRTAGDAPQKDELDAQVLCTLGRAYDAKSALMTTSGARFIRRHSSFSADSVIAKTDGQFPEEAHSSMQKAFAAARESVKVWEDIGPADSSLLDKAEALTFAARMSTVETTDDIKENCESLSFGLSCAIDAVNIFRQHGDKHLGQALRALCRVVQCKIKQHPSWSPGVDLSKGQKMLELISLELCKHAICSLEPSKEDDVWYAVALKNMCDWYHRDRCHTTLAIPWMRAAVVAYASVPSADPKFIERYRLQLQQLLKSEPQFRKELLAIQKGQDVELSETDITTTYCFPEALQPLDELLKALPPAFNASDVSPVVDRCE